MFRFMGKVIKLLLIVVFTTFKEIGTLITNISNAALKEVKSWEFTKASRVTLQVGNQRTTLQEGYSMEDITRILQAGGVNQTNAANTRVTQTTNIRRTA